MPLPVASVYSEAASVANLSPRAAAALLRVSIELLVTQLGGKGSLSESIGNLVAEGLSLRIQQAMDVLRVTGNKALHAGDLTEVPEPGAVPALFSLVNLIVDELIARPDQLQSLYEALPESTREHIEERDRKTKDS